MNASRPPTPAEWADLPPGYVLREDASLGKRLVLSLLIASGPASLFLVAGVLLGWPLPLLFAGLAVLTLVELAVLAASFRSTRCPQCHQVIRVPWHHAASRRGGEIRYPCAGCRVVWTARVSGGSSA